MKRLFWYVIGASNYTRLRHWYQLFVERHLLGNREVFYSQMGEDMILKNLFRNKKNGFFIDIGAYHPVDLSNTFYFYKKGWRGINVDATPGSMKQFKLLRPEDINLEIGVADKVCEMNYYLFTSKTLNTFTDEGVLFVKQNFNLEPFDVVKTSFFPLSYILEKHIPSPSQQIDFLSIDVEGADEIVLRSNDWNKYKPKVVCIERHMSYKEFNGTSLCQFLEGLNYHFAAKSGPSFFYYLGD